MTQNKLAFILALILSGMIMVMFLPALTEARELTLIDHINSVRSKPLKEDKFLTNLAAERCRTMKEWSHQQFYSYANEIMYTYSWRGIKTRNKYAAENDLGLFPPTSWNIARSRRIKEEEWRENMRNNFNKEQSKAIMEIYLRAKGASKKNLKDIKNQVINKYNI